MIGSLSLFKLWLILETPTSDFTLKLGINLLCLAGKGVLLALLARTSLK